MRSFFSIFTVLMLNFIFSGVSYGQKRKVPEKMIPISFKSLCIKPSFNAKIEVDETSKSVMPTKVVIGCHKVGFAQTSEEYNFHSIDKIIYLNDLLYKRSNTYFQYK